MGPIGWVGWEGRVGWLGEGGAADDGAGRGGRRAEGQWLTQRSRTRLFSLRLSSRSCTKKRQQSGALITIAQNRPGGKQKTIFDAQTATTQKTVLDASPKTNVNL